MLKFSGQLIGAPGYLSRHTLVARGETCPPGRVPVGQLQQLVADCGEVLTGEQVSHLCVAAAWLAVDECRA